MKIYSRTGDAGQTGLLGGGRVSKASARIAAIGDIDELNASLGTIDPGVLDLAEVQSRLFDLGAQIAAPADGKVAYQGILPEDTVALERDIDRMDAELAPLRSFILPGGTPDAANLHVARAVCRRAERRLWELHETETISPEILVFVNRLSDWLFVAARYVNQLQSIPDRPWSPRSQIQKNDR